MMYRIIDRPPPPNILMGGVVPHNDPQHTRMGDTLNPKFHPLLLSQERSITHPSGDLTGKLHIYRRCNLEWSVGGLSPTQARLGHIRARICRAGICGRQP